MTSIGIISDVHADYDGLVRALNLLRRNGVDEIWCAGDLVDRGSEGNEVVNRIRHEQIPTVQGNHDFMARRDREQMVDDMRLMEGVDDQDILITGEVSEINLTFLDYLPPALKFERDGLSIELTHANTFDQITYIYPNSRPSLFQETLKATLADIVILGHTHKPMKIYQDDKLRIINSGSVFMNYGTPEHSCGILTLPDREFAVYDLSTGKAVPVPTVHLEGAS